MPSPVLPADPVPLDPDALAADELLARVRRGDDEAFALLYDVLAPRMLAAAQVVVNDRHQAEDVVQESFVELWRTAPRYDAGRGSAQAWAVSIVRHRAIDRVRAEQAHRRREESAARLAEPAAGPEDPVLARIIANGEADAVQGALGFLTPLQREAVRLAFYTGHSYPRVAEILGVPLPTAKARIRGGLHRLATQLTFTRAA